MHARYSSVRCNGRARVDLLPNLGLVAVLLLPIAGAAQDAADSARSVVKITCSWEASPGRKAGQMRASGFVWNKSRYVVTALHAAVGCSRLIIYSEHKKDSAPARVVKANQVADLALLEFIGRDLGLDPIPHLRQPPDTHDEFYTWGYPQDVPQMTDVRTDFAGGLARGVTTLEAAYGSIEGIDDLFKGQTYPQRTASILRVTSTLQPGQSGAPILDEQGRVVAIADGGLLGGYLTVNWSIPAHIYLDGLPNAKDPIPGEPSKWAVLFSQSTPDAGPAATAPALTVSGGGVVFHLVRKVTLADYVARDRASKFPSGELQTLQTLIPGRVEDLTFDIYEEPKIGTTVAIPTGFALEWNPTYRAFETRSASGAVRHFIGTRRLPDGPRSAAARTFAARFDAMADWQKLPSAINFSDLDTISAGTGDHVSGTERGTGKKLFGSVFVQLDYGKFIGLADFREGGSSWTTLSKDDTFFYLMMVLSARLTNFAIN